MVIEVTPYYENTTQTAYYNDTTNELRAYRIYPADGYVLHDKSLDVCIEGEATGEVLEDRKGYTPGMLSVGYNYDFEANPREIYAVMAESEV